LEARLKPLHRFRSFNHAKLWLNGYVLKWRYTKYVSCKRKLKRLNGKRPLKMTKKRCWFTGIILTSRWQICDTTCSNQLSYRSIQSSKEVYQNTRAETTLSSYFPPRTLHRIIQIVLCLGNLLKTIKALHVLTADTKFLNILLVAVITVITASTQCM
jgi:hypothetical protein